MRILVTGAFGYLGGRLTRALAARHDVIAGARSTPDWVRGWAPSLEVRPCDVLEEAQLGQAMDGVDAVLHLASLDENEARRDPGRALLVSGEGTRLALQNAERAGVRRFVYLSTFHVYGPSAPTEIVEGQVVPRPAHPYGISRLAGEGYCYEANQRAGGEGPFAVIFRLSNAYGAPAHPSVDRWSLAHNDFCRQAVQSSEISLKSAGLQHRDLIWVEDVARAVELALDAAPARLEQEIFHVGSGVSSSIRGLAQRVSDVAKVVLGREVRLVAPAADPDAREVPVHFDIGRLAALGFSPQDGLVSETERCLRMLLEQRA